MEKLPIKLASEPLIEAIFEFRFTSAFPASSLLPGILFNQLPGDKRLEPLSTQQIPQGIRAADPNLKYVPLLRLTWDKYFIGIGDTSLGIACSLPYPGWAKFKPAILDIAKIVMEANIVQTIERCGLKYTDVLPYTDIADQINAVNMQLKLGSHTLAQEVFQVRMEVKAGEYINAVHLVSSASIPLVDGSIRTGLIVDVDTIFAEEPGQSFHDFAGGLESRIESMHTANKKMFFDCLTEKTLLELKPEYE